MAVGSRIPPVLLELLTARLRGDPLHRMAHLMLAVMAAGMPPSDLDHLLVR